MMRTRKIRGRSLTTGIALFGLGTASYAFSGGLPDPPPRLAYPALPSSALTREFIDTRLDTAFSLGSINDTVVINPIRIAVSDEFVYVFDAGDDAVKAFDMTGEQAWRLGREGGGPGEFRKVRDITVGIYGDVLVTDNANARLSVLSPSGEVQREISLQELGGRPEQVVQIANERFVVWALSPRDDPLVLIDGAGQVLERAAPPFRVASRIPFLGSQAVLANDFRYPHRWVYGFVFAGYWRVLRELSPISDERVFVEEVPLPEVEMDDQGRAGLTASMKSAVSSARSMDIVGDTLYVLYGGRTADRSRLIDLFRVSTGAYEGTILLPGVASYMGVNRRQLVVLVRNPYPRIVSLRYEFERRTQ